MRDQITCMEEEKNPRAHLWISRWGTILGREMRIIVLFDRGGYFSRKSQG